MTLGAERLAMIAVEVCNMSVLPVNKEKDAILDKWSAQLLGSSTIKTAVPTSIRLLKCVCLSLWI